MITPRERQDLRRVLHGAGVLRDTRERADRRQRIAYPRGGRRADDVARVAEYRRLVSTSDPFRWHRQAVGWAGTIGGVLAVATSGVALVMWLSVS